MKIIKSKKDLQITGMQLEINKLREQNKCMSEQLQQIDYDDFSRQTIAIENLRIGFLNKLKELDTCKKDYDKLLKEMKK